jgi:hypothetical protein
VQISKGSLKREPFILSLNLKRAEVEVTNRVTKLSLAALKVKIKIGTSHFIRVK